MRKRLGLLSVLALSIAAFGGELPSTKRTSATGKEIPKDAAAFTFAVW